MRLVLFFAFALISVGIKAQNPFQALSLNQAIAKAKANNKLVFVQFDAMDCDPCNVAASKVVSIPAVAEKLTRNFICIRVDSVHPDRNSIAHDFNIENYGSLFLDADKG